MLTQFCGELQHPRPSRRSPFHRCAAALGLPLPLFSAVRTAVTWVLAGVVVAGAAGSVAVTRSAPARATLRPTRSSRRLRGIHKIQHIIVIMQENRSFDSYFGTYQGADGIPHGVCVPDPKRKTCDRPYHDPYDLNRGGPHAQTNATRDIDGGRMNGFVTQAEGAEESCVNFANSWCRKHGRIDVMGYHDAREIPNYWDYARNYVLQDHMFEPNASESPRASVHGLRVVGEVHEHVDPFTCKNELQRPGLTPDFTHGGPLPVYALDRPHLPPASRRRQLALLHHEGHGARLHRTGAVSVRRLSPGSRHAGDLEPAPLLRDGQTRPPAPECHVTHHYFAAARTGSLPSVSWIVPDGRVSEHPPALGSTPGEKFVTR